MNTTTNEEQLLKHLAVAIVEKPRSTIKELAESVEISKATLHRFCGTRENLQQILTEKSSETLERGLTSKTRKTYAKNKFPVIKPFPCTLRGNGSIIIQKRP